MKQNKNDDVKMAKYDARKSGIEIEYPLRNARRKKNNGRLPRG
jgi:hypothetical protein